MTTVTREGGDGCVASPEALESRSGSNADSVPSDPDGANVSEPETSTPEQPTAPGAEPTVGTGSVFAVGCSVIALLVVLIGIALILLLRG